METLDIIAILGAGLCFYWLVIYTMDAVKFQKRKKNGVLTDGKIYKSTELRKWFYTGNEVRYAFTVDGEEKYGQTEVRGVMNPNLFQGKEIKVYYNAANPEESILKEQCTMAVKNIVILAVIAIGLVVTIFI
ncbi:MAG: DUF3592 domain-containing protein [Clostridiales bacterium]|nr:DUF3592 domain-containing protein [Candidatus Blautia equi]